MPKRWTKTNVLIPQVRKQLLTDRRAPSSCYQERERKAKRKFFLRSIQMHLASAYSNLIRTIKSGSLHCHIH